MFVFFVLKDMRQQLLANTIRLEKLEKLVIAKDEKIKSLESSLEIQQKTGKSTAKLHGRNFQATDRPPLWKVQQLHNSGFVFTAHLSLILFT